MAAMTTAQTATALNSSAGSHGVGYSWDISSDPTEVSCHFHVVALNSSLSRVTSYLFLGPPVWDSDALSGMR